MMRGNNLKYVRCWREMVDAVPKSAISESAMALLCFALTIAFFHSVVFPRTETFVCNEDNTYQYYPWMNKLATDWRSLTPPLWDFSVDAGFPFSGELQTGAFYPINILYVWITGMPTPANLDALILLHFAAAMWGMTLFLRQRGLKWWASLFGGAVFCLVGPVAKRAHDQANIFEGLIYLPWILYFFERGCAAKKLWWNLWTGLAGVTLAFSLLAGHPQPFIYNGLMLMFFAAFLVFERRTRSLGWVIGLRRIAGALVMVAVIVVLFTYGQLAASHEYFARSYRWVGLANPVKAMQVIPLEAYNLYKMTFSDLFTVFTAREGGGDSVSLYLTITALVCACLGLAARGNWRWFAVAVSGFALIVALAGNTPFGWLIHRLPVLSQVRAPVRILYLYQFCLATLAATGLQIAVNRVSLCRTKIIVLISILAVFIFETLRTGIALTVSTRFPLTADQLYHKMPLITYLEEQNAISSGMYRVVVRPADLIPPNGGDVFRLNTLVGHRSSQLISYFDFLSRDWSLSSSVLDQIGARYAITDTPIAGLTLLSSFRGSAYTLSDSGPGKPQNLSKVTTLLYERPSALPIFRWSGKSEGASPATIGPVKWGKNSVNLQVSTNEPRKLIFAENIYPGWHVRINGHPVNIDKSNIFMSATVPPGTSTVRWWYRPWWLVPGLLCWLIGILSLAAMAVPERYVSFAAVNWRSFASKFQQHNKRSSLTAKGSISL
jgi:hypothetical protein